jgi:16S rRNA (guanine527-N7)-methyltransferase
MEILLKYFPGISPLQQESYIRLAGLVGDWNRRINLVSRKDTEHLAERHILHSLGITFHADILPGLRVLDVGTGGGFPGLPLAIMYPDANFTLIDSTGKKINAVRSMAKDLGLQNVCCLRVRAEDYNEKTDMVVSRAVTRLDRFTGWVDKNLAGKQPECPERSRGIWYLKGGDLDEELKPYPAARVFNLNEVFEEEFFETKKLVWLPPGYRV